MNALTILALALVIPVMLIPAVLVWYVNLGGILTALREDRVKKTTMKTEEKKQSLEILETSIVTSGKIK